MADVLISGPAGANKTAEARRLLEAYPGPAIALDFQSVYAALLLLERMADGRYPPREPQHSIRLSIGRIPPKGGTHGGQG